MGMGMDGLLGGGGKGGGGGGGGFPFPMPPMPNLLGGMMGNQQPAQTTSDGSPSNQDIMSMLQKMQQGQQGA